MSPVLIAAAVIAFFALFALGGWLMLSAVQAGHWGKGTFCVKCGNELDSPAAPMCTKCRRVMSDSLRVICDVGEVNRARLLIGVFLLVVAVGGALTLHFMNK